MFSHGAVGYRMALLLASGIASRSSDYKIRLRSADALSLGKYQGSSPIPEFASFRYFAMRF